MDRLQKLTHEKRRLEVTYTNKFAWEALPDGAWEDKACFIVGGGPSLAKFDWDLLKGKLTIGINRAYEMFEPTIIFGMDPNFVRWVLMGKYGEIARTKFLQSSAMKIWVNTTGIDLPDYIYILKCWHNYLEGRRAFPLTMKEGIGHGNNSGYGALNLAACLGANPIYLLGYDMQRENGKTHWHSGHPKLAPDHVPNSFKKHFDVVAEILRKQEITVINLNPDSALNCFPKMEMLSGFNPALKPKSEEEESAKVKPSIPTTQTASSNDIMDNAWKGQRCFIIGDGASLKDFEFARLAGELVIGVKRAFERIDCSIMFATGAKFYNWITQGNFGAKVKKRFNDFKGHKIWLGSQNYQLKGVQRLTGLDGTGLSFSMKSGLKSDGNSGYGALNLAVCLGANPIYLLGFDMKGKNGRQAHWHDGYPEAQPDTAYEKFKTHFESAAPILKEKGIKVVNLNPDSELKCFERGKLEDIEYLPNAYIYSSEYDSKKVLPHEHDALVFKGSIGFGDNFYQRPVIKDLAKSYRTIYIITALPEVYWDIPNVKFIRSTTDMRLRTQVKHIKSLPASIWSTKPDEYDFAKWDSIGPTSLRKIETKYVELENKSDFDFSFPVKNEWVEAAKKLVAKLPLKGKKLCIVRRPTLRREWNAPSRNPKSEYYQLLIDRYKKEYFFLGLADIKDKEEWFAGKIYGIDKEFNKGEISLTTIFGLMKIADMTLVYPGFFMVAAMAIRATCFCIFGGCAAPYYQLRKNIGLQNLGYVAPEPFCSCHDLLHKCKKDISLKKVIRAFEELKNRPKYLKTVLVGSAPGMGDAHWVVSKMQSFKERLGIDKLRLAVHTREVYYYTSRYLRLVPFIDEVVEYKAIDIGGLYDKDAPLAMLKNLQGLDYLIDPGSLMWLKGISLEDILPEYDTDFHYPINLPKDARKEASAIKKKNNGKLTLLFTSSVGNNGNWNRGAWTPKDWVKLAEHIFKYSGVRPLLIGAKWDRDYAELIWKAGGAKVMQDYVGKTDIPQMLSLIREANLVMGYVSGIPIMAAYFNVPTVMFWAINGISRGGRFDPPFRYTWVPPEMRNNGRYLPVTYDDPNTNPKWIFNKVKKFLNGATT